VRDDVSIDSETLLMTDFMNLKIKSAQSFRYVYRGRLCVRAFIGVSDRTCMSICICIVFKKRLQKMVSYFLHFLLSLLTF
jgi:hypothetical protein